MRLFAWSVPFLAFAALSAGAKQLSASDQNPQVVPTTPVQAAPDPDKPLHLGGGVKMPVVLYTAAPEYSQQAKDAKFSGQVLVYLWIDKKGNPTHVRVVRGVGMGLDENAVAAVRQYKFKPAMLDGQPVVVDLYVEVNFHIL